MPHYFFHVQKSHKPDTTGVDFTDLGEARIEAARVMAQEMKHHPSDFWNDEDWHVQVTDERGLILFSVYSSAFNSASTRAGIPHQSRRVIDVVKRQSFVATCDGHGTASPTQQ